MTKPSETPLTDFAAAPCAEAGYQAAGCVCVSADFARQLERQNAALRSELRRYLPVLERAESDPYIWTRLTRELGIATTNSIRAALASQEKPQ